MTFEEFKKIIYYTEKHIHIPLDNRNKLEKIIFFSKGKLNYEKLNNTLYEIYEKINKKL